MIDILIPTYNRSEFLKKNILQLIKQIKKYNLESIYTIIISDNRSEDDTWNMISSIQTDTNINIQTYRQDTNVGLEPNTLLLLKKANADYIMYLGDDDYLPDGYLEHVVKLIKEDNAACVIPGFSGLYPNGDVKPSRNARFDIKRFEPGPETVYEISNYGHQLSGLVTKRQPLFEEYTKDSRYRNIYPFIFFVSYWMLNGITFYTPKFQVLVSQNNNKDWTYDDSGLLVEVFKNYKILFASDRKRYMKASISFIRSQPWRLGIGYNPVVTFTAFLHLMKSPEIDSRLKLALFWLYPLSYAKGIVKIVKKKIDFRK